MKVILFRGRPGVGKTTLSSIISKRHNIPVLRKDDIYHVSAKQIETHESRNDISYETIYKILEANAETKCTFILDCPFQYPGDLELIRVWCDTYKATLHSILVTCSDEMVWAKRISERDERPFNIHHFTDFERLRAFYGTVQLTPEVDELLIDTVHPIEDSIRKIEEFI